MGEEARLFIERVAEVRGTRQSVNRVFLPRQEMPACRGFRPRKGRHGRLLFLQSHVRSLTGIETHEDDFVLAAGVEGDHFQGAHKALLHFVAKHGAAVINEGDNDRLAAEVASQKDLSPNFIAKRDVQRQLRIQLRIEADVPQLWRQTGHRGAIGRRLCAGRCRAKQHRGHRRHKPANELHLSRAFLTSWTPPSLQPRSEEHTSELQSLAYLVCRLLLEKKKQKYM